MTLPSDQVGDMLDLLGPDSQDGTEYSIEQASEAASRRAPEVRKSPTAEPEMEFQTELPDGVVYETVPGAEEELLLDASAPESNPAVEDNFITELPREREVDLQVEPPMDASADAGAEPVAGTVVEPYIEGADDYASTEHEYQADGTFIDPFALPIEGEAAAAATSEESYAEPSYAEPTYETAPELETTQVEEFQPAAEDMEFGETTTLSGLEESDPLDAGSLEAVSYDDQPPGEPLAEISDNTEAYLETPLSEEIADTEVTDTAGFGAYTVNPNFSQAVPEDAVAFAEDVGSRDALEALFGEDSSNRVITGGIPAAVTYLNTNVCPSLVIVDLSNSTDPMTDLEELADVCVPGTIVITLGATNDIGLYRRLRGAGIADYLVKPLVADTVGEAVQAAMLPQGQSNATPSVQGKLFCFIGARGGVGATTVALNCANLIAADTPKNVGLVDMDLQFGTVALSLDMEASTGLREALDTPERIDAMFIDSVAGRVGQRLKVLAAEESLEQVATPTSETIASFINELRSQFDVVVLDVPRHLAAIWWQAFSDASKIIVVTDLSLAGLRDTGRLLTASKDIAAKSNIMLVANRVGVDKFGGIEPQEFEKAIDYKFDFTIPEDGKAAGAAARSGRPVTEGSKKEGGKLVASLRSMSEALVKPPAAGGRRTSDGKKKRKIKLPFMGGKES